MAAWLEVSQSVYDTHVLERRLRVARLGDLGDGERAGAAEHHDVEQRVGTQPVGAVHRRAGRFARGEQAGNDAVLAVVVGDHLRSNIIIWK